MFKALRYVALGAMTLGCLAAEGADANIDADGMPIVYLRGDQTGNGWAVNPQYRFTRTGNTYTLHVDALDGEFKFATDNWTTFDYGAPVAKPEKYTVTTSQTFDALRAGGNLTATNLRDVTVTFTYTPDAPSLPVTMTVGGRDIAGLSGTLPVLYINVYTDATHTRLDNEVISKDLAHKNYFSDSEYWLDLNGCEWLADLGAKSVGSADDPLPLEIKARGNWTRIGFAKKPFKLKLGKKQSLLGMTKSKHYAILAHADDTWGYLRNFTGFELGHRIGLPWTPSQQPVEVVINGDYRGLYFLTESIRVGDDRVPVTELDDNVSDPGLVSGGYLVELDNYDEENQIRMDERSCIPGQYTDRLRVTWDTPEEYSDLQKRFITDQFTEINNAVGDNDDRLWSYLDLDDAARYYIVEEMISHVEAYHGSTYLFRDRGEGQKWHFSPLWDCGNAFNGPTDGYFYDHSPYGNTWIPSMRRNATFNDRVTSTWLWFMQNRYDGLTDAIDSYVDAIREAAKADRRRWKDQPVPDGGQPVADNTDMTAARNRAVGHLKAKISWLKGHWGDYTVGTHTEPTRDTTEAAPLPDYAKAAIDDIPADGTDTTDCNAVYYNLQGIRVDNPIPGEIYISVSGNRTAKVIAR